MTDFEVISAAGALMFTSPDVDLARAYIREKVSTFPGLKLEAVERIEKRRRVWTDRAWLREVA